MSQEEDPVYRRIEMEKVARAAAQAPVTEVARKYGVSDVRVYAGRRRLGKLESVDAQRFAARVSKRTQAQHAAGGAGLDRDISLTTARRLLGYRSRASIDKASRHLHAAIDSLDVTQ